MSIDLKGAGLRGILMADLTVKVRDDLLEICKFVHEICPDEKLKTDFKNICDLYEKYLVDCKSMSKGVLEKLITELKKESHAESCTTSTHYNH